ncbi:MAG: transcriptional repressor [bacterium]
MTYIENSIAALQLQGYKVTTPRISVLKVLDECVHPVSSYEVHDLLGKKSGINVVTIYRVLDLLQSLQLVHRVASLSKTGYMKCHLSDFSGCHHLLVCRKCYGIQEFAAPDFCRKSMKVPPTMEFEPEGHLYEIIGLCKSCLSVTP